MVYSHNNSELDNFVDYHCEFWEKGVGECYAQTSKHSTCDTISAKVI